MGVVVIVCIKSSEIISGKNMGGTTWTCKEARDEFAERTKERGDERAAVAEAIEVLGSDESREVFRRAEGGSFVEVERTTTRRLHEESADGLARVLAQGVELERFLKSVRDNHLAGTEDSSKLAKSSSRSSSFLSAKANLARTLGGKQLPAAFQTAGQKVLDRVVAKIHGLVSDLKIAQAGEVVEKDRCIKAIHTGETELDKTKHRVEKIGAKIELLQQALEKADAQLEEFQKEVEELNKELKTAGEDYGVEREAMLMQIADQFAVQQVIGKAVQALNVFYASHGGEGVVVGQDTNGAVIRAPTIPEAPVMMAGAGDVVESAGEGGESATVANAAELEAMIPEVEAENGSSAFTLNSPNTFLQEKVGSCLWLQNVDRVILHTAYRSC